MKRKDVELIVTKRSGYFKCNVKGVPAEWDCGKTVQEAVGKWVLTHGEKYGMKVSIDIPQTKD